MIAVRHGIPQGYEDRACALYWDAFGDKLGRVMGPRDKGLAFVRRVVDPTHAISATDRHGRLLGVAGFKTAKGALVAGTWSDMMAVYGPISATWRAALISLIERDTENDRFLMDGIFVAPEARGQGVGTALLEAIVAEGHRRGYSSVRLDVIDTNPRARALYERQGFKPLKTVRMGVLRYLFKFTSATTMVRPVTGSRTD